MMIIHYQSINNIHNSTYTILIYLLLITNHQCIDIIINLIKSKWCIWEII